MSSDARVMREKPDFPDWLSPMLVKELRQGMRSRVFLICFMAVQAVLMFPALIGLLNASTDQSNESVSVLFWMTVGLPLLIVMPFTGLSAISQEKTANTLELIFLTRLTSRRIVFGKWVALIAQTLLLVSAILPYAVLRYYLGGVNLTGELKTLAWMLAASAIMTGVMVGISPALNRFGRLIIPIVIVIGLFVSSIIDTVSPVVSRGPIDWQFGTALAIQAFILMLLMLEVGAAKIGPEAENHSTPKRLLALASTLTAIVYSWTPNPSQWIFLAALVIAGPVLIGAVCEPVREVPSIYRPFLRMGIAGRALGRLLYPGWPAGVLFSILLLGIAGFRFDQVVMATAYTPTAKVLVQTRIMEVALAGAFYLPVAFFRLFRRPVRFPTAFYLLFQAVLSLLVLIAILVTQFQPGHPPSTAPSGFEMLIAWIPTCTLWLFGRIQDWSIWQQGVVLKAISAVALCAITIALVRMWPAWRTISTLEKTAAILPPDAEPDPAD